jgi:hypothetical protein
MPSPSFSALTRVPISPAATPFQPPSLSEVELELLEAILTAKSTASRMPGIPARPWNAPQADLELVDGFDPRD